MRKILSGHLGNKGVTLITLIIAITIFAVFITVFSYVMIAKHGSEALYVQSTQAYAVAQAGIEYGIRYATDNSSSVIFPSTPLDPLPTITKTLENGSFTIEFNPNVAPKLLTSTGTVGIAERKITVRYTALATGEGISLNPNEVPTEETIP